MNFKTPVMLLQEYCQQKCRPIPEYNEIPVRSVGVTITFSYQVKACGKTATGTGSNKRLAKHDAAKQLLEILGIQTSSADEDEVDVNHNAVSALNELCVQNYGKPPQYEDGPARGPSHCPIFTCRCIVNKLEFEANGTNKKAAKQNAADAMLKAVRKKLEDEINENPISEIKEIKVELLEEAIVEKKKEENDIAQLYRKLKGLDINPPNRSILADRHNFFTSLNGDDLYKARKNFTNPFLTSKEKIDQTLKTLKLKYVIEEAPSTDKQLLSFRLLHDVYDLYFAEFEKDFWQKLEEYFIVMLDIEV